MKNFIILAIAASATIPIIASGHTVSGTVIDAFSAESEPGANIRIFALPDTVKPMTTSVTDLEGKFIIKDLKTGSYILSVDFPGTIRFNLDFDLNENENVKDLGTIALQPETERLQEVVVTGRKPIVIADGEKVTYNVDQDPASGQKTVIEMLRKVPMVTVDGQDNIRVNGDSNFQIYVNGKPDPMLSQNASQILKSLPASSVEKLEVILEPGAKYDAEGTGGILNIVTRTKSENEGFLTKLNAGITNRNANLGVYAITKKRNITGSINVNYFNGRFDPQKIDGTIKREYFGDSGISGSTHQDFDVSQRNQFINGSFNLSWEPNTNNLFTLSGSIMHGIGDMTMNSHIKSLDPSGSLRYAMQSKQNTDWQWGQFSTNASYQHNFRSDNEGHNIVISYQFDHGTSVNDTKQLEFDFIDTSSDMPAIKNHNDSPSNTHTIQTDYTLPFASRFTLESGIKQIFRINRSWANTLIGKDFNNMQEASGDREAVSMRQYQNVSALYSSLSGKWGGFSVKAGIRYEHTHTKVDFLSGSSEGFRNNLNDIVPNLSAGYSFSPMSTIRLAYQTRIRRPSIDELNPHLSYGIADIMSCGNPNLDSEKTHSISLTFSDFKSKVGYNIIGSYQFSNDQISQFSYIDGYTFIQSYGNLGTKRDASLSLYFNYRPTSAISLSINATGRYKYFNAKNAGMRNHGWTGNFGGDFSWNLPSRIQLNAYGGYSLKNINIQGDDDGWKYYGISASRTFLKDERLKISVNAANFFDKTRFVRKEHGKDFNSEIKMRMSTWYTGISVEYTLGGLNGSVKRTASQIINDDVERSQGGGVQTN